MTVLGALVVVIRSAKGDKISAFERWTTDSPGKPAASASRLIRDPHR